MNDYTPSTDEIRHYWAVQGVKRAPRRAERSVEFDRWLAKIKAEAWDEGFDAGVDHAIFKDFVFNPYSIKSERAQKYIDDRLREDKRK